MKNTLILIIIGVLASFICTAQQDDDLKQTFLDAEYYILYQDYQEALPLYKQLVNNGHENAYIQYRIGECYLNIPSQCSKSIPHLEKANQGLSEEVNEGSFKETSAPYYAVFLLGAAYHIDKQLDLAIETYTNYKNLIDVKNVDQIDYVNHRLEQCSNAKELIRSPVPFDMKNIGHMINSNFPDIRPVISNDEKNMLFTTKLRFYDAVFHTNNGANGWSNPINLTPQLQTDGNMHSSSISNDGTKLFLFKNDPYNGDLYMSSYSENKWSIPEKLNKNINTRFWETHASLSSDNKTLYFTSDRKGGHGGLDIYKSVFNEELNEWGPAINLGPSINSPYDEETPFITADGETLYFSSRGHYNMGGYDIFYSQKTDSGIWSTPINIGYPINTTGDNIFFQPVQNGQFAYMSLFTREGYGQEDIYRIELYSSDHPKEITLNGKITLLDNRIEFTDDFIIKVLDSSKVEVIENLKPDKVTGKYSTILTPGTYKLIFNSNEYNQAVKTVYIPFNFSRDELTVNVQLTPSQVTTGQYISIKNVLFGFDDYSLSRDAQIIMERVLNIMKKYPSLTIEVIGHTDAVGSKDYNYQLSVKRANSVIKYLNRKGINKDRFVAKGAGKSQPVAINTNTDGTDNPEGRKFNRRVEMKIHTADEKLIIEDDFNVPEYLRQADICYSIFLTKTDKELPADFFNKFSEFRDYQIKKHDANGLIYTLGNFKNKSECISILNTVLEYGFDEAEIIDNYELMDMVNK